MKKVIVISYYFPPGNQIGGIRPYGLAKYLPAYGWEAIVLTPKINKRRCGEIQVIETDYIDILKTWKKQLGFNPDLSMNAQANINSRKNKLTIFDYAFALLKNIFLYPDPQIGWYAHAVEAGEKVLEEELIGAIISTSQPATCHLIAAALSEKYSIPWIADYRDLWSQDFYKSNIDSLLGKLRGTARFEHAALSGAKAVTTVSAPLADSLMSLHRDKPVYAIPNGFDSDDAVPSLVPLTDTFTVTYTGSLYRGKRDPGSFLKALSELISEGRVDPDRIEVQFFCPIEGWLIEAVSNFRLDSVVRFCGFVPKQNAVEQQRQSQILLLLLWDHPQERGVFTGKIFEYLAAKRPIISVNGPEEGVVKQLLNETKAGTYCVNHESIKESLLTYYLEYLAFGCAQYRGIDSMTNRYSHKEMAKSFAQVLDSVTK